MYAAIFVISGTYFSRTDFARNMLGIVTLVTFVIHWYMIYVFQRAIESYRRRLNWVYQTYFSREERVGLDLPLGPTTDREQWQVSHGPLAGVAGRSCLYRNLFVVGAHVTPAFSSPRQPGLRRPRPGLVAQVLPNPSVISWR